MSQARRMWHFARGMKRVQSAILLPSYHASHSFRAKCCIHLACPIKCLMQTSAWSPEFMGWNPKSKSLMDSFTCGGGGGGGGDVI